MKSFTAKEMVLAQDWYFLAFEDFRPTRVGDDVKLRCNSIALGNLRENDALFENIEDAIQASNAIRAYLAGSRLSRQSKQRHQSQPDKSQEEAPQKPYSLLEETLTYINKHTQSGDCGQRNSEPHYPRTVLIKIFHP